MSSSSSNSGGLGEAISNLSRATLALGIAVIVIVVAVVSSWAAGVGPFGDKAATAWSAVFLNDSEVFFGHVKHVSNDEVDLVNVYYLQRSQNNTQAGQSTAPSQLAILGLVANQIQCPKDEVIVNRTAVLNIQTLQDSSFVVSRLNTLVKQTQNCFQPSQASPTPGAATSSSAAPTAAATPSPT